MAAAVILRQSEPLDAVIRDSKLLSERQRNKAFRCIIEAADVGVGMASALEIDRLNILRATHLAMRRAVAALKTLPDCVLVDGNQPPGFPSGRCVPIPGGDRISPLIGCASIIAKVVRDEWMLYYERVFPGYGFARHKGYGTAEHARALRERGVSPLHRRSFRPVADALHYMRADVVVAAAPEGSLDELAEAA